MNLLDVCIVILCAALALFGLLRGLVHQAFSLGGLILGHLLAVRYNAEAQKLLQFDFPHAGIAAYVLALLAVYVAVRLIGLLIERLIRGTPLSGLDRLLGALMGAAKGALFSILLVFVLVVLLPRDAVVLKNSKLAPRALVAAGWLEKTFPERIRESFREKLRAAGKEGKEEGGKEPAPSSLPRNRSRK